MVVGESADGGKKKRNRTVKRKMKESHQKRRRERILFFRRIWKPVATEMLDVGYWLGKQSDPDKTRTHFHSGYLPKAGKGDDNTTGKKQAHEMRGVLLTILCYCLLQVHYKELSDKIGGDVLTKFVHIFEQTILMEDWLGKKNSFQVRKLKMPKNIFHSTVTNLLKPFKERKEKDPNWQRFISCIIFWIISLIFDVQIMFLIALVNTT